MKYFLGFVLAVMPVRGQSGPIAPLALYTQFQSQSSPAVVEAARQEVAHILSPLGFPFEWWSIDGRKEYPAATELAVITFRGNCTTANLAAARNTSGPLGFTYITDGQVLPFAAVDCDRIRGFLRESLLHESPRKLDGILGRAVGRVLAHELYHVFARTKQHGANGVAEPAFTKEELLSDQFQLEAREFRVLRANLKQARSQNSRVRAAASPVAGRFIFQERGCAVCHGRLGGGTSSAPALRGALGDAKAFAARLAHSVGKMSSQAKAARLEKNSTLDEDEIADVVSFLNGSE